MRDGLLIMYPRRVLFQSIVSRELGPRSVCLAPCHSISASCWWEGLHTVVTPGV